MTVTAIPSLDIRTDAAAISGQALTKRYRAVPAVVDVDITVATGSVHGLLGPNGAGKTTLLRMMFGLVRPDAGTIHVLGRSPFAAAGAALHGVAGFVETPRFYPYLSATRNLDLLAALDGPQAATRVGQALDAVGLNSRAGQKVSGYSSGMRQRLGIAAQRLELGRQPLLHRRVLTEQVQRPRQRVGGRLVAGHQQGYHVVVNFGRGHQRSCTCERIRRS